MRRASGEAGYVAIVTALLLPVLIMFCAIGVDTARWYVEMEQMQKAADAASLAGVPYIPQDFASARDTAVRIAAENGYDPTKRSKIVIEVCAKNGTWASSGSPASDCQTGLRSSQLRVTIRNTIPNFFATVFGFSSQGLQRTAVSDFTGPAPLGSPCNSFGNMPPDATPFTLSSVAPATCAVNNYFWGNIFGPDAPKEQGDQYATKTCTTADLCAGNKNTEYNSDGYYYILRVAPGVTQPIKVEVYDPAFVETGDLCASIPAYAYSRDTMNHHTTDAKTRYLNSADAPSASTPTYCTGDNWGGGTKGDTTTEYSVLNPIDSLDPTRATPVSGCATKSWGTVDLSKDSATNGILQEYATVGATSGPKNPKYDDATATVFHQWVPLCTIGTPQAGDYYIHVKTLNGNGLNRFALRASTALASDASRLAVSGWNQMSIYANANGRTSGSTPFFNLIRVPPGAAGNTISVKLYDIGDINGAGTLTVQPPAEYGNVSPDCVGTGVRNGTLTNCSISGVNNPAGSWNGRIQTLAVPIPQNYACDFTNPGGCWWRISMNFPGGGQDTTTWNAQITGDPVRLTQ